jgi:hypothetical protein
LACQGFDLAGDDIVGLDLGAFAVGVFAAAEFADDVEISALGDLGGPGGDLAPTGDSVLLGAFLALVTFAEEDFRRKGEVEDGLTAVEVLRLRVGPYEALQFNFVHPRKRSQLLG